MKLSEDIQNEINFQDDAGPCPTGTDHLSNWADAAEELEAKAAKYDALMSYQKTYYDVEAENERLYRELQAAEAKVEALQKSLREADTMYVASDADRRSAEDKLAAIEAVCGDALIRNDILDIIRK